MQILSHLSFELPCEISRFSYHLLITVYAFALYVRAFKLLTAVDSALRKRYMK
jgi:hypothetical protein